MAYSLRDLVKLQNIQKYEKNTGVGGWVKPQLVFSVTVFVYSLYMF